MDEDKTKDNEPQPETIEQILQRRAQLDQVLRDQFTRKMAIVFTDVCGYTHFMSTMGDIRGRAWMQKHHDIVLPLIESYGGTVLDIMGDGVMASFADTLEAAKATIAIQEGLDEYNSKPDIVDEIHVTIGINAGKILVDKNHIAGDVVNVAARIESLAEKDQILVSKSVYEDIRDSADVLCRYHGTASVKGKDKPLEIYRLVWRDQDVILSLEPRPRSVEKDVRIRGPHPLKVLQIDVARGKNRLKISAYERVAGEESTVRHYDEMPISMDNVNARCREIVETLNKTNRRGFVPRDVLMKLREIGQVFSDDLFPHSVKDSIQQTTAEHLSIHLDDQFVQIPWELLHDGQQFLCQRFSMGRLVRTRQKVMGGVRALARPLKMLILADPKGDLQGAYAEGTQLYKNIDKKKDLINASFQSENINTKFIKEKIRNFDLIHFAGHADYSTNNPAESGWRLADGVFMAQDIMKLAGTSAMPTLIFSNACQSARTEEWDLKAHFQDEIFGLANAFVLAGVKHYIGTFWEILDEPSSRFSLEFYENLLAGQTIGSAMRQARLALIEAYGEETIVWGSYLLYGDPTYNYMDQIQTIEGEDELEPAVIPLPEVEIRASEDKEVIDFAEKDTVKPKKPWPLLVALGLLILVGALFWGYREYTSSQIEKYAAAVQAGYETNNFDEALNACSVLEGKAPDLRLIYLVRGNIAFRKGNLEAAEAAFKQAIQAPKGTASQTAEAFNGLGRIASMAKNTDVALNYYREAAQSAPTESSAYLYQAMLMDQSGDAKAALNLLDKAREMAPKDAILAAVAREAHKKVALSEDQEKQARINQLVKDLLAGMATSPRALPSDGWTSRPLTLWIMDFKTQGYSLQEGQERLLAAGLADQFLQQGRVQLVERALLDKLMQELKLSTTGLIDRRTALSLGRIMAARLILSGRIVCSGAQNQVSMRLFETETGRITAAVSETFPGAAAASDMAPKLSETLLDKIEKQYPVRAKISKIEEDKVELNIGQNAGVTLGQHFKALNEDITLEVISVQPDTSLAKVIGETKTLNQGQHLEAL